MAILSTALTLGVFSSMRVTVHDIEISQGSDFSEIVEVVDGTGAPIDLEDAVYSGMWRNSTDSPVNGVFSFDPIDGHSNWFEFKLSSTQTSDPDVVKQVRGYFRKTEVDGLPARLGVYDLLVDLPDGKSMVLRGVATFVFAATY